MLNRNSLRDSQIHQVFTIGIHGMMLVAFVEGKPHWRQKALLMESVRIIGNHVTTEEGLNLLENIATYLQCFPDYKCMELFESAIELPDQDKQLILSLCIKMAFEDWGLSDIETELIIKVANWIKIDSSNRSIVVNEILQAMNIETNKSSIYSGVENLNRFL